MLNGDFKNNLCKLLYFGVTWLAIVIYSVWLSNNLK